MISLKFCLFALFLASASCLYMPRGGGGGGRGWRPGGGGRWPPVVSRRDAEPSVTSVLSTINATLGQATDSITAEELSEAVDQVEDDVEDILDDQDVDKDAVSQMIQDCSEGINSASALSALFDDSLTFEANNLATALALWKNLAERAKELQDAGNQESLNVALAAIGDTAEAIGAVVDASVDIMDIQLEDDDDDDDDDGKSKRRPWTVNGNIDQSGTINGGVSYRKGGFSAGVRGHWNPFNGSRGVSAGFTWRFG